MTSDTTAGCVLVVDDDPQILAMLKEALQEDGYDVATARNGIEAMKAVRRRQPDVILLDLMMPVVDGAGFMELYRQVPGPHAPILVITAAAGRYRSDSLEHARDVLAKPLSIDRLLAAVRHYTRHLAA